jgi:hypothetical protein
VVSKRGFPGCRESNIRRSASRNVISAEIVKRNKNPKKFVNIHYLSMIDSRLISVIGLMYPIDIGLMICVDTTVSEEHIASIFRKTKRVIYCSSLNVFDDGAAILGSVFGLYPSPL